MPDSEALRYAVQAAMPSAVLMREVDAVIQAVRDELYRQGFDIVPKDALRAAWEAGRGRSGEGFNAEHGEWPSPEMDAIKDVDIAALSWMQRAPKAPAFSFDRWYADYRKIVEAGR